MLFGYLPMARAMRAALTRASINDGRLQSQAVVATQEIMQDINIKLWQAFTESAVHVKRVTVVPKDLRHTIAVAKIFDVAVFSEIKPSSF